MHVFTQVITRLKADVRDAEAGMNASTDSVKRAHFRGKVMGLRRALHLLETERERKMDDMVDLVRDAEQAGER